MDLLSTHPVKKSDLGFHGNLFGGKLLSWIDAAVAAYAMEKCRSQNMITIAMDQCVFKKPAKEKQLVPFLFQNKLKEHLILHLQNCNIYNI